MGREKERDSNARREEEHLRAQHQARERRTSYRESQGPPSPLYRDEEPLHSREKCHSGTPTGAKLPNPFAPLGPIGGSANTGRARRASVSYGGSSGGYTSAPQGYPGMMVGSGYERRERDEVPYIRGGVPVSTNVGISGGSRGARLNGTGSAGIVTDDIYPNDGRYHPHPLEI
ncbi:hypothetical protein EYC80_009656 [Monilinia laxa]|uniref:Uncharacterized protein n=1 Tax=Monilinia laxa TaxID=61186 RepID=A0A5N6JYH8_MONLA|nr:hypothetical protein EYC80_009656 [Monilinia laxa]